MVLRLLKEKGVLGPKASGESCEQSCDFDGRWVYQDRAFNICNAMKGVDVDAYRYFQALTSSSCELMIFDDGGELLHVVSGQLTPDGRKINWSSGAQWQREALHR